MIKIYKPPKIYRKILIFFEEFKESSCFRFEYCTVHTVKPALKGASITNHRL